MTEEKKKRYVVKRTALTGGSGQTLVDHTLGKMLTPRYRFMFMTVRLAGFAEKLKHPDEIKTKLEAAQYQRTLRRELRKCNRDVSRGRNRQKRLAKLTLLRYTLTKSSMTLS